MALDQSQQWVPLATTDTSTSHKLSVNQLAEFQAVFDGHTGAGGDSWDLNEVREWEDEAARHHSAA